MVELHPELGLRVITSGDKKCEVCSCKNPIRSFDFRPHTYNYETLEVVTANPALSKVTSESHHRAKVCHLNFCSFFPYIIELSLLSSLHWSCSPLPSTLPRSISPLRSVQSQDKRIWSHGWPGRTYKLSRGSTLEISHAPSRQISASGNSTNCETVSTATARRIVKPWSYSTYCHSWPFLLTFLSCNILPYYLHLQVTY